MITFQKHTVPTGPDVGVDRQKLRRQQDRGRLIKLARGIFVTPDLYTNNAGLQQDLLGNYARIATVLATGKKDDRDPAHRTPMLFGLSALNKGFTKGADGVSRLFLYGTRNDVINLTPTCEVVLVRAERTKQFSGGHKTDRYMLETSHDRLGVTTVIVPSRHRALADALQLPETHVAAIQDEDLTEHLHQFMDRGELNLAWVAALAKESQVGAIHYSRVLSRLNDIESFAKTEAITRRERRYDVYWCQRLIGHMASSIKGVRYHYNDGWVLPLGTDFRPAANRGALESIVLGNDTDVDTQNWRQVNRIPPYIQTLLEENSNGIETPLAYKVGNHGRHLCNIDIVAEGATPFSTVDQHSDDTRLSGIQLPGLVAAKNPSNIEDPQVVTSNQGHQLKFVAPDWWTDATAAIKQNLNTRKFARLSGMQLKVPCTVSTDKDGNRVVTPADGENFTHILKVAGSNELSHLPAAEYMGMSLAKAAGYPTPEIAMIEVPMHPHGAYLVERFDIPGNSALAPSDGGAGNYILEDFASMIGNPNDPSAKYEGSYEACLPVIEQTCTDPEASKRNFIEYITLNYLLLNGDLHLKNLSLIKEPSTMLDKWSFVGLTPAYDITSVPNSFGYGNRLGMCINEQTYEGYPHAEGVTEVELVRLAMTAGLDFTDACELLTDTVLRVEGAYRDFSANLLRDKNIAGTDVANKLHETLGDISERVTDFKDRLEQMAEARILFGSDDKALAAACYGDPNGKPKNESLVPLLQREGASEQISVTAAAAFRHMNANDTEAEAEDEPVFGKRRQKSDTLPPLNLRTYSDDESIETGSDKSYFGPPAP